MAPGHHLNRVIPIFSHLFESGHPKAAAVLIAMGTLIAVLAIFSIWANRQALNTDNWVGTSGKLLEKPFRQITPFG